MENVPQQWYASSSEQAIANAKEAIELHIEGLIADGEPVPEEKEHPQALVVRAAA